MYGTAVDAHVVMMFLILLVPAVSQWNVASGKTKRGVEVEEERGGGGRGGRDGRGRIEKGQGWRMEVKENGTGGRGLEEGEGEGGGLKS